MTSDRPARCARDQGPRTASRCGLANRRSGSRRITDATEVRRAGVRRVDVRGRPVVPSRPVRAPADVAEDSTPPGRTAAPGHFPAGPAPRSMPWRGRQPGAASRSRRPPPARGRASGARGPGPWLRRRVRAARVRAPHGQGPLAHLGPHRPFRDQHAVRGADGRAAPPARGAAQHRPEAGTTRPSACTDPTAAADPTATARPATPRSSTGSVSTGSAHRARAWPSGKTSSSVQW